jgi:hypothetical protein
MNRRAALLIAALATLVAAIVYDARVATKVLASRGNAATLSQRLAEIEWQIRFRGRQDASPAADAAGSGREHRQGNADAPSAAGDSAANRDPLLIIAGDAKLRANYMASFRDGLDTQYGLFIHMLGLLPAEEAEFKQLIAEREAINLQVAETAANEGLDPDNPQMKALSKQLNRADSTNLKPLLGPTGVAALRQYWSEWPIVTLVQNFGGNLPEPTLTMDQATELLPVLSAASQRDTKGTVVPDTVNVQQALNAAAPILNSEQLLTLSAMLQ